GVDNFLKNFGCVIDRSLYDTNRDGPGKPIHTNRARGPKGFFGRSIMYVACDIGNYQTLPYSLVCGLGGIAVAIFMERKHIAKGVANTNRRSMHPQTTLMYATASAMLCSGLPPAENELRMPKRYLRVLHNTPRMRPVWEAVQARSRGFGTSRRQQQQQQQCCRN
ncbi:hypothetical protein Vretimale_2511, partial [Volvox reticuliferus]